MGIYKVGSMLKKKKQKKNKKTIDNEKTYESFLKNLHELYSKKKIKICFLFL